VKIVALVPAHNEEDAVGKTVRSLKDSKVIDTVIVIDDGSTDKTAEKAEKAGAEIVRLTRNTGKGGALNQGLKILPSDYDAVAFIDADVEDSAGEVDKLAKPVIEGEADMSIAVITAKPGSGGFGLVKGLAQRGLKKKTGLDLKAPLSGQRVIKQEVIDAIGHFEAGYGLEVALTIDAVKNGFKVVEVPVDMYHAYTGKTVAGFLHRGRQYLDVLRALRRRKY
jgi:glycosyltransferase involved in cell wall biosynthesis